ncbi:hypothetical protein [Streptomyces profundus]|uniref:hypothetical protein n=1 Tax=Streptomyces profundus TaxID=2867410 RepID=UPI001D167605|nr:hypothetical protein [Streptomyces sp. MA3_2.13]UED86600.1 hypothetical protein K4G22_22375 [Streptomyces sp. MA3_2.13]
MVDPIGPTMAGGTTTVSKQGYVITFFPDANNYDLIQAGKNPVYYYLPESLRVARKNGDEGDFKFSLLRFAGQGEGKDDVAGGLLSLTVTGKPDGTVLKQAMMEVEAHCANNSNGLWNSGGGKPQFQTVTCMANTVSLSGIKVTRDGFKLAQLDESGKVSVVERSNFDDQAHESLIRGGHPKGLDPNEWLWVFQGEAGGSIDPNTEQAFAAIVSRYPAEVLYKGFKDAATSPVYANSVMEVEMWTPKVSLRIEGDWESVYEHFSMDAQAHSIWWSADVKRVFDEVIKNEKIKVTITPAGNFPGADELAKYLREKSDLLVDKMTELGRNFIFQPVEEETPAESSSSDSPFSWWGGGGLSLRSREEVIKVKISYEEEMQFSHRQTTSVSSSLEGMFNEMKPGDEQKYFPVVHLDDWPAKINRVSAAYAEWPLGIYDSLSIQIGYPNDKGTLIWKSKVFTRPASGEELERWEYSTIMWDEGDVKNPPAGWEPDRTFIKRAIHFNEPDSTNEKIVMHVAEPHVQIDPEPNGTPVKDDIIEVRASSENLMHVRAMFSGRVKEDQYAELMMELVDKDGKVIEGAEPAYFYLDYGDKDLYRHWIISPAPELKRFQYTVTVVDYEEGVEWSKAYDANNNLGPRVPIPKQGDKGVTIKATKKTRRK